MSNLVSIPRQDKFTTRLATILTTSATSVELNTAPDFSMSGTDRLYLVINAGTTKHQIVKISALSGTTATVDTLAMPLYEGGSGTAFQQPAGSPVIITNTWQTFGDIETAVNSKLDNDGGNTSTAMDIQLSGTNWRIRRDGSDMKFTDDNNSETTLSTLAASGNDEKVKVSADDTTADFLINKITGGDGISVTEINGGGDEDADIDVDLTDTTVFVSTSSGAGDSGKVARLNASGQFPSGFVNAITSDNLKFGGDGADGALDTSGGTVDIDLLNSAYVVKNYTSINVATNNLTFSNPASGGSIVVLRSQGNVTVTATIDASGLGAGGGAGGTEINNGAAGTTATHIYDDTNHSGGGGGGTTVSTSGGTAGAIVDNTQLYSNSAQKIEAMRHYKLAVGSGGGGGGGGQASGNNPSGGVGGRGGGALLIECKGDLNFTGTITVAGDAGNAGDAASGTGVGGGGGGGGAGGSAIVIYNTATATSGTLTSSGGSGGAGGAAAGTPGTSSGAGGGGGGLLTAGTAGGNGVLNSTGGTGGTGGNGYSVITENLWFV